MVDVWSFCNSVSASKSLCVQNLRLGTLFRVLQIGCVVLICFLVFVAQGWYNHKTPVGYGIEMWASDSSAAAVTAMSNSNVRHCSDPNSYWYNYNPNLSYRPSQCQSLSQGDRFSKKGTDIYLPTYVVDKYTVETPASSTSLPCSNTWTCTAPFVQKVFGGLCLCEETSEIFAKNPEQVEIWLNHGFEVTKVNAFGFAKKNPLIGRSTKDIEKNKNLVTIITQSGDDKKRCSIGGREMWTQKDAESGIHGPLQDWLKCGGLSLDDLAPDAASGLTGYGASPSGRLTGAVMNIELVYRNYDTTDVGAHTGPVCFMRIVALAQWNTRTDLQYEQVANPGSTKAVYRYRYQYGVSVSVSSTGDFVWFDITKLVLLLTSIVVIFKIPGKVVSIILLYLAGRLSRIWKVSAVQPFGIVNEFDGQCVRLFSYACNFKCIAGATGCAEQKRSGSKEAKAIAAALDGTDSDATKKDTKPPVAAWSDSGPCIDKTTLHKCMSEALYDPSADEQVLNDQEIDKMVQVLNYQISSAGASAPINLADYIRACNSDEAVELRDIAACFDDDHEASCFETLLGDIRNEIKRGKKYA